MSSSWHDDERALLMATKSLHAITEASARLSEAHHAIDHREMPDWLRVRLRMARTELAHIAEDLRQAMGLAVLRGPREGGGE